MVSIPDSKASFLRAMAANYAGGHRWDHLDGNAVTGAADEIEALRSALGDMPLENAKLRGVVLDILNALSPLSVCGRPLTALDTNLAKAVERAVTLVGA